MLRPELRWISPNDYRSWEEFASAEHPEPWDEFGWFVLDIGVEGDVGTYSFQVLVATPAAVTRAKGGVAGRRFLVVDSFEPEALAAALRDYVSSQAAHTWDDIIAKLRRNMYWEYEKRWS
jgi:Immunity protein 8